MRWRWWMGFAVGAATAYFLDAERGHARRERARERLQGAMRRRERRAMSRARDEARDAPVSPGREIEDVEHLLYATS
jgi:hypothetical protein